MPSSIKVYSQCSRQESRGYRDAYFMALDLNWAARSKFEALSRHAFTAAEMCGYRAKSFEAEWVMELIKNEYRAYLANESAILPPGEATLAKIRSALKQLTAAAAVAGNATEIQKQLNQGMNTFGAIHGA